MKRTGTDHGNAETDGLLDNMGMLLQEYITGREKLRRDKSFI
jgi:hypothetical protein